jgi:hypothetical protein
MMNRHPADKMALKAVKSGDRASMDKARGQINGESLRQALFEVFDFVRDNSSERIPLGAIQNLVKAKMLDTAEFVFLKHPNLAVVLDLDVTECVKTAPTLRCVKTWIGKGAAAKTKTTALISAFEAAPVQAAQTVLALWFFHNAPPERFKVGLDIFAVASSSGRFASYEDLLAAALPRDSSGKFFASLIEGAAADEFAFDRLVGILRNNPQLRTAAIEAFAKAVDTLNPQILQKVVSSLFAGLDGTTGKSRRLLTSQMLRLAGAMMEFPSTPQRSMVMKTFHNLHLSARKTSGDMDSCTICYHGADAPAADIKICVTVEGAALLSLALEKIVHGDDPLLTLEATALNLGMEPIGKIGEAIKFDPALHRDTVGGGLPGDVMTITRIGWILGSHVVERAKVEPTE